MPRRRRLFVSVPMENRKSSRACLNDLISFFLCVAAAAATWRNSHLSWPPRFGGSFRLTCLSVAAATTRCFFFFFKPPVGGEWGIHRDGETFTRHVKGSPRERQAIYPGNICAPGECSSPFYENVVDTAGQIERIRGEEGIPRSDRENSHSKATR